MTLHHEVGSGSLARRRVVLGWLLAVAGTTVLTAVLTSVRQTETPTYEAMLYLALAVGCALVGGRWPAIASSVLGAGALNYYFTDPLRTLAVASVPNVLTLVLFVVVSVAVASVVDAAARRRQQATLARNEASTLTMLNRTVLGGEYGVDELLELVCVTFGAEGAELLPAEARVNAGDTAATAGRDSVLVLRGTSLSSREQRTLSAFASHLGVLQERDELARQTAAAQALEAGNRTRTALLAAVSHELRTPLAGIRAAAETLRRNDQHLPAADRIELLTAIEQSTARLTSMVTDLLDMSRLQTGAVRTVLTTTDLEQVVELAMSGMPLATRVQVCAPLLRVRADVGLLERAVANLIDNALRHTDGKVQVSAITDGPEVQLRIADHGKGVPEAQRDLIFQPFWQRQDAHAGDGVGLGLAVARGLVEAQGGAVRAEATPGGGLTMVVELAGAS